MSVLNAIPLFAPGTTLALAVAAVVAAPVAARLRTSPPVAGLLVASLGTIAAATLTPSPEALLYGRQSTGACDLSRMGFALLRDLSTINDFSLNVLLFVPLGLALALLPRRRRTLGLLIAALALPPVIELAQLLALPLDRACESGDVFDNLTGLAIGYIAGFVIRLAR